MEIIKKFQNKIVSPNDNEPITLAFLGDSVTQGCFEMYKNAFNRTELVFDIASAYHTYVREILCTLYPRAPINIINAGISGGSAVQGYKRLERDVLRFSPDLVVVAFGLNDANDGIENLATYQTAMTNICTTLVKQGIEVIVLTTNMMVTKKNYNILDKDFARINDICCHIQNDGVLDAYMDAARAVSKACGCRLCDCYQKWKTMYENGVNTDLLLSNGINHPTREMNYLFAHAIVETMFS